MMENMPGSVNAGGYLPIVEDIVAVMPTQRKQARDDQHQCGVDGMESEADRQTAVQCAVYKNVLQCDLQIRQQCEENATAAGLPPKTRRIWATPAPAIENTGP